jgi:hypothetical protein
LDSSRSCAISSAVKDTASGSDMLISFPNINS